MFLWSSNKLHRVVLHTLQEYLHRPTDPASWWPSPDTHILGGRDLYRPEHGTWLGVTKQGRLACLTNFREEGSEFGQGKRSRGAIVNAYLRLPPDDIHHDKMTSRTVAENLIADGLSGVGGFSLLFGRLKRPGWGRRVEKESQWEGLAIVSNRSEHVNDVKWLCVGPGETHALSNSHYGDRSWPKVVDGEKGVMEAIKASVEATDSKDALLTRLLHILSTDTLRRQEPNEDWDTYTRQLRDSIFIRPIGKDKETTVIKEQSPFTNGNSKPQEEQDKATGGVYGTQKQTIMLVNWEGNVTFFERTLIDGEGRRISTGDGDLKYEFKVDGWQGKERL
jgi:uncharacterized protein with NRDE domain